MPLISTLVDSFNDNIISAVWGNAYGGVSETGGRARVPCGTGYAGYQSGAAWTLAGSSVYVQVPTVPAKSTATEAYCGLYVLSPTAGTRIGYSIDVVAGMLRCQSQVDYYDAAAVSITYSGTTHRWLRLAEAGGTVTWSTSTDGSSWTTRRTLATPAWVATATDTLTLDMFAHRDAGTADFAEFDNCNTLSNGAVVPITAAYAAVGGMTATAVRTATLGATLTTDNTLGAEPRIAYGLAANLTAESGLDAQPAGDDSDFTAHVASPRTGWEVGAPWT